MKINPNCFVLLQDFFIAEDQYKLLKECFDLTENDWENAFQLISDFGCSDEYNEQFKRYYQGWKTNPSNFFNPKEWVDELEAELKRDKSDNIKEDIDWEISALFYDEWYETFSEIHNSLMQVIESIDNKVSNQVQQLKKLGITLKICLDDFVDKEDFLVKALEINKQSNSYQTT
jgi:hypothetical protein